jgi:Protoheme ferro-lyase (ferrochelatase)
MVPIAFVTDHIETLYELGVELLEDVEEYHPENIAVTEGLNDHPDFIAALADESLKRLAGLGVHPAENGKSTQKVDAELQA